MPRYNIEPAERILQALETASALGLTKADICRQAHVCSDTATKWIGTLESRGLIEECKGRREGRKVYRLKSQSQ